MAKIYLNESQLKEMIKDIILEYNEAYNPGNNNIMNVAPIHTYAQRNPNSAIQNFKTMYNNIQPQNVAQNAVNAINQQQQPQQNQNQQIAQQFQQQQNQFNQQQNQWNNFQDNINAANNSIVQQPATTNTKQTPATNNTKRPATNNTKQQYNYQNKTMNSVSKLPLPIQQMINNSNMWPKNAQQAYKLVNNFQNYPTQGAGWLKNANILATQLKSQRLSQLIAHCRKLINNSANKQNSQQVTNYAYNNPNPPQSK